MHQIILITAWAKLNDIIQSNIYSVTPTYHNDKEKTTINKLITYAIAGKTNSAFLCIND